MVRLSEDEDAIQFSGQRRQLPTDWKAAIAAAALFCSGLYFAGSIYRDSLLAAVDQRIAAHSEAAAKNRTEFFRDLESKAGSAIDRLGQLESQCASVREWRPGVDAGIRDMLSANASKLQRLATCEAQSVANAIEHARLERRIDAIDWRGKRTP